MQVNKRLDLVVVVGVVLGKAFGGITPARQQLARTLAAIPHWNSMKRNTQKLKWAYPPTA